MSTQQIPRYPLIDHHPEDITTATGRPVEAISREAIMAGDLQADDVRISAGTLELQARVAEAEGRPALAENFRRAAELTALSDDKILAIYNALRPRRSTKAQLEELIRELEEQFHAPRNAQLVREALAAYEARDLLAPAG